MVSLRFVAFIISMIIYIIGMNFFGQRIIDHSEKVFYSAYFDSKWYIMPVHLRRMILMIQNQATKTQRLSAGKMGEVSMEAAGIVISFIMFFGRKLPTFLELYLLFISSIDITKV